MNRSQLTITGFCLNDKIYEGERNLVYRGYRESDRKSVILKLPKSDRPSVRELLRLRNYYTITKNLNLSGIVQSVGLEACGNGLVLVMPDENGISLQDYASSHPLNLAEFLAIALQLADILHVLYQHRIIHKDIKPANILMHLQSQQIQLIDFSIASLLPTETEVVKHPNVLEGTLDYMSPEQTGRMNRGIDYRTDFYALGVTLFELLTGQLPFRTDNSLELVHCHLAKPAPSVCAVKPEIPAAIAQIVAKLMAKNAEDRYQSALGLKYDLEIALNQLHQTGTIALFEIATRDISDRFLIPDKLYGREVEVQTLLDAFDRVSQGSTELMLVAGFSGIGKTAVVNEVHKPIVRQQGYFIKGKFDQFNRSIPFSAFVQAFRDLVGQMLSESDIKLQVWKSLILAAVGENGQAIVDLIPELGRIIGTQPPAVELSGTAAQNRFNLLFQKFIQVFAAPTHPLVMFLDDLQWADAASLKLLQLLMQDTGYLLVLGAYRDNEVSPAHPLMLTLEMVSKTGATLNTITLPPLSQVSLNHLVADTLNCSEALAQPLTKLVHRKTGGNPFFATQFLKVLHRDGSIEFDLQAGNWQCDIVRVRETTLTDDVVELMALQLQKLPEASQSVLKLAACIGNQFDLATLAIASERLEIETAAALWTSLQEGLILPISETYKFYLVQENQDIEPDSQIVYYRFLHDRIQQAAYSLIPDEQKQSTHLKIGHLLLSNASAEEREDRIFAIVNQLNIGRGLISQTDMRSKLLQLNLTAAQRAEASTAYSAATQYLEICIELLPEDSWHTQTELTQRIYELAAEVAYLSTNYDRMEQLSAIFLSHTDSLIDKIRVYEIKILGAKAQGRLRESIQMGLQLLKLVGVEFPEQPTSEDIGKALQQTLKLWKDCSVPSLLDLAVMTARIELATMRILTQMIPSAYQSLPILMPLLIFAQIELCITKGNCEVSAFSYADYGLVLCGVVGDLDAGYQFGQLALNILDRFQSKTARCRTYFIVHSYISHWMESLSSRLPFFQEAYQVGLETGDLESSALNAQMYCSYAYFAGYELSSLGDEMKTYRQGIVKLKQELTLNYHAIYHQTVLNLLGQSDDPCQLEGEVYAEAQVLPMLLQTNNRTALYYLYFNKTVLCYLFGQYQQAADYAVLVESYADSMVGMFAIALFCFYSSLIYLKLYSSVDEAERIRYLDRVATNQEKLKRWADGAPMNHLHKFYLVEAERQRILGNKAEAIEYYDLAIQLARDNAYTQEEALANELAADFYRDWSKERIVRSYLFDAYDAYTRWGAKAKIEDLEKRFPQIFVPIPQKAQSSASPRNTSSYSFSGDPEFLDLATLLKASQAISGEIELDKLLETLLNIIIANAGAEKGVLLLQENHELQIVALVESEQQPHILSSPIPFELSQDVPINLVNWVKRSLEPLVLSDARGDSKFVGDRYITQHQPKSILCIPILKQIQLLGVLYLENNLTVGAFTSDRIAILNLLCTQAAISLEHARLFYESRQSEINLQQSNAFLRAQRESSPDGILVIDVNRRVSDYNQGFVKVWNIPQNILDTKDDYQLLGFVLDRLDRPDEFLKKVEYLYQHPDKTSFDEISLKNGRVLERTSNTVKLPSGEHCGRIWCFRDISDRKAAEAQFQHQTQQLESAKQQLEEYSRTLEKMVGERTQELSQALTNLQATQQELIQSEKMAVLGQLTASIAHEINTPLGVIRAATANIVEALSTSLEQLPKLVQSLSPQQQGDFLSLVNAALQVRYPLSTKEERQLRRQLQDELSAQGIADAAGIATQLSLLRLQSDLHPYQSILFDPNCAIIIQAAYKLVLQYQSASSIQQEVNRAAKIVFALKTYSHRNENAEKGLVQISDSIEVALTLYQNRLKHGINTIRHYAEVPEIFCNQDELTQVWVNLIDNAIYAMGQHGTLEIDVTQKTNCVVVEITDSGSGIPYDLQPRIFEPFITSKPRGEGSGLGLDIVRKIVQKHSGEVQVRSHPGRTTFTVCLPLPTSAWAIAET